MNTPSRKRRKQEENPSGLLQFLAAGAADYVEKDDGRVLLRRADVIRHSTAGNIEMLASADLLRIDDGVVSITDSGVAKLKRLAAPAEPYLAQHERISERKKIANDPVDAAHFDESESPLAWLARRKDRDGKPLIDPAQLAAGERMRADFTRAGMTPRVTANWIAPVAQGRRGGGDSAAAFADVVIASKERLNRAIESVGPEFSGLLLDVCCFLKGLETVERERRWPQRTAKVVLGLALDRLARHYGISVEAKGPARGVMRTWQAEGARPTMEGY